jgi:hypothetical protein
MSSFRDFLYTLAKLLDSVNVAQKGRVGRRILVLI